ncbi:MAG: group III truncated hemoglobin, partial [Phycisphaerales bacterium]|nr:group III truncated hemoglobin [Phycisphaerales bacterium]
MTNIELQITIPDDGAEASSDIDPPMIGRVVDAFYGAIRRDDVLGPIFAPRVRDWSAHLDRMRRFWSTVILRSGEYAGRPLEVHARIPGLGDADFGHWLDLWRATVTAHVPPAARIRFVQPAERMARTLA